MSRYVVRFSIEVDAESVEEAEQEGLRALCAAPSEADLYDAQRVQHAFEEES